MREMGRLRDGKMRSGEDGKRERNGTRWKGGKREDLFDELQNLSNRDFLA